ncbi:U6 snRNA phosphodiesterase Usb1 [Mycena albidolilacea]|uniref:U6 snRNA phosphodiesterase 1 n=1 Tax=Mycena albidolilacea TaxID=1033008 RepID=A0AAD7AR96_9AGAR|nr:U6 snRNA phosphodiesterase Usb1 [Mycena albidolilacea]
MKRDSALVSYSSSEDSEPDFATPPPKKRKLPVLSATLAGPEHVDNPSLHQGRARTMPHVDGQYATHVYASVPLDRGSPLFKLLCKILDSAKKMTPTLHDFWTSSKDSGPELHISLSRPIYLRAHQRESMKRAVKLIAEKSLPFTASFARISELVNDDGTRIFLALEIGAGHQELTTLTTSLTPTLRAIRQQEFYSAPRFHASIGWALLDRRASSPPPDNTNMDQASISSIMPDSSNTSVSRVPDEHPKITKFPPVLLPALNEQYGSSLAGAAVKSFDISEISIRIGKEVSHWQLNGT